MRASKVSATSVIAGIGAFQVPHNCGGTNGLALDAWDSAVPRNRHICLRHHKQTDALLLPKVLECGGD